MYNQKNALLNKIITEINLKKSVSFDEPYLLNLPQEFKAFFLEFLFAIKNEDLLKKILSKFFIHSDDQIKFKSANKIFFYIMNYILKSTVQTPNNIPLLELFYTSLTFKKGSIIFCELKILDFIYNQLKFLKQVQSLNDKLTNLYQILQIYCGDGKLPQKASDFISIFNIGILPPYYLNLLRQHFTDPDKFYLLFKYLMIDMNVFSLYNLKQINSEFFMVLANNYINVYRICSQDRYIQFHYAAWPFLQNLLGNQYYIYIFDMEHTSSRRYNKILENLECKNLNAKIKSNIANFIIKVNFFSKIKIYRQNINIMKNLIAGHEEEILNHITSWKLITIINCARLLNIQAKMWNAKKNILPLLVQNKIILHFQLSVEIIKLLAQLYDISQIFENVDLSMNILAFLNVVRLMKQVNYKTSLNAKQKIELITNIKNNNLLKSNYKLYAKTLSSFIISSDIMQNPKLSDISTMILPCQNMTKYAILQVLNFYEGEINDMAKYNLNKIYYLIEPNIIELSNKRDLYKLYIKKLPDKISDYFLLFKYCDRYNEDIDVKLIDIFLDFLDALDFILLNAVFNLSKLCKNKVDFILPKKVANKIKIILFKGDILYQDNIYNMQYLAQRFFFSESIDLIQKSAIESRKLNSHFIYAIKFGIDIFENSSNAWIEKYLYADVDLIQIMLTKIYFTNDILKSKASLQKALKLFNGKINDVARFNFYMINYYCPKIMPHKYKHYKADSKFLNNKTWSINQGFLDYCDSISIFPVFLIKDLGGLIKYNRFYCTIGKNLLNVIKNKLFNSNLLFNKNLYEVLMSSCQLFDLFNSIYVALYFFPEESRRFCDKHPNVNSQFKKKVQEYYSPTMQCLNNIPQKNFTSKNITKDHNDDNNLVDNYSNHVLENRELESYNDL